VANERSRETQLSLPSDREIVLVRALRAPRSLVFAAWTRPEHLRAWYVCPSLTMPVCEMDVRVGGRWRYVLRERESGHEHALSGEYREIIRPERLVFSERYEPVPGSDHVVTVTFVERDGLTTVTQHFAYASKESRDGHLQTGMDKGAEESFVRLEQLAATLAAGAGAAP
jgi:uncharacterized protein YndB with AHSA1/START domain